jgi:hypothetical protein
VEEDDRATIGKTVDRGRWGMTPPTSDAYYNPLLNEIVSPATFFSLQHCPEELGGRTGGSFRDDPDFGSAVKGASREQSKGVNAASTLSTSPRSAPESAALEVFGGCLLLPRQEIEIILPSRPGVDYRGKVRGRYIERNRRTPSVRAYMEEKSAI